MELTPSAITGRTIRAEMARRGASQTDLAHHLDMSQTAISKRLRGVTPFSIDDLVRIADYLDMPLGELLPNGTAA